MTGPTCLGNQNFFLISRWLQPCGDAPSEATSVGRGRISLSREQFDCKEFMDDGMYCTRESNPHCGTDGMTYGNKCSFCKAVKRSQGSVRLEHLGKC
nr:serine protease inhibitor Kazal-type 6-like isoform X2 [Chrysemys picta bellii]